MNGHREKEEDLASELRQGAGREWAEEAAEDERLTEKGRVRRMTLGDRGREFVEQGKRLRAEAGAQTFTGRVVYAGSDYAVLERADDLVALRLEAATWTVEHAAGEGATQYGGAFTFAAHLSELEHSGEFVRLLLSDGRALLGSISVAASDHLDLSQDGVTVVVPYRVLVAVVRPTPR